MGQLLLRKIVQHIALILGRIQRRVQVIPAVRVPQNPCVMPGCDAVAPQQPRAPVKAVEFQVAVAVDAGVGRAACRVSRREPADHRGLKIRRKVKDVVGHPQCGGHLARVLHIRKTAAGGGTAFAQQLVIVQAHRNAHAAVALLLQKVERHAGIHAAAHRHKDFFAAARRAGIG